MSWLRLFFHGGLIAYRALFNFRHPSVYIPTLLGSSLFQILFYVYLGRYSGLASDEVFVAGGAILVSAVASVYGLVLVIANERQFGTLSSLLATPANRVALYLGRTVPLIVNGMLVSGFGFAAGYVLVGFRLPADSLPAFVMAVAVAAWSGAGFGLALGAVALRARDIWISSNLAYYLLTLPCGVNVPLWAMPGWLEAVGRALPLTHSIEAVRRLAGGATMADVAALIGREAVTGAAYAALGYVLLRLFETEGRHRASLDSA